MKRLVIFLISICMLLVGCSKQSNEEVPKSYDLPYSLDDGKVVIQSLFESSIPNPDDDNLDGEDIASLEITNESDEFLDSATIDVTMDDGMIYHFSIEDLKSGETLWCFDTTNQIHEDSEIKSIEYTTNYLETAPLREDSITTSVTGSTVTLTNITSTDLVNITVTCHATMDDIMYGGYVYQYNIQSLPAGMSVDFDAYDSYLDSVEVVGINF